MNDVTSENDTLLDPILRRSHRQTTEVVLNRKRKQDLSKPLHTASAVECQSC
jgi:hypothetical protein